MRLAILLHAGTLIAFAIFGSWPWLSSRLSVPDPCEVLALPPLHVRLHFMSQFGAAELARLAPTELQRAAASALRMRLDQLASGELPSCSLTWEVSSGRPSHGMLVLPISVYADGSQSADWHKGGISAVIGAPDHGQDAAQLLNGTSGVLHGLATALHRELRVRACALSRNRRAWRPPGRVSLLLLQERPASTAAVRAQRLSRVAALRSVVEDLLATCWPVSTPPVHSQTSHYAADALAPTPASVPTRARTVGRLPPTAAEARTLLHECSTGGQRCARGVAPTIAAQPPLRLLLYQYSPCRARRHRQRSTASDVHRDDVDHLLEPLGALVAWCEQCNASATRSAAGIDHAGQCDDGDEARSNLGDEASIAARLVVQVRRLVGLPPQPGAAPLGFPWLPPDLLLPPSTEQLRRAQPAQRERGGGLVHGTEAAALQLGCTLAHLDTARAELATLRSLRSAPQAPAARAEVQGLVDAAHLATQEAVALVGRAEYAGACELAGQASTDARSAARHSSLPVDTGSTLANMQTLLSTWAPLFFPIATSVITAVRAEFVSTGASER